MRKRSINTREIAAAERGRIIQCVLVDGWNPAQTAEVFGVGERQVVRWVAAYRRFGMASLRGEAPAEHARWLWLRRLRGALTQLFTIPADGLERQPARCIALPRDRDDGRAPGHRHGSLWN